MIELLAVLGIMAILATAVLPLAQLARQRDQERDLKRALWEIRDAIDAYKRLSDIGAVQGTPSGYPPSLKLLVEGVVDRRSGATVYFLRRVPRDPFADPKLASEATWGLRSYRSPPDRPEAGDDVFDVFSRAKAVGLDGTEIGKW